jgi:membrane dipeptidase
MNRREFFLIVAGAAASAPQHLPAQRAAIHTAAISERSTKLYQRALVLDCNSGPPWEDGHLPLPPTDLEMVRNCGIDVVKWTIGGINADFAGTVKEIAYIHRMIEVHPSYFIQVRVPGDMNRAKRERKMGIIFSFESVDMLDGKLERIELFRNLGVRVMQLSYNRKSPFAAGVMEPDGGGLTSIGHEAVKAMNNIGVAVDVSHANLQTTADVLAASSKPVIISHAGCSAVHPHPRNKTDDQLRAMADKGGVVGIYDLMFLTAPPRQPTLDDYMAHMEHALKVAGEDHVGVGSDVSIDPFDTSAKGMAEYEKQIEARHSAGLSAPEEDRPPYVIGLNFPRKIEIIADRLLKQGYSAAVAEKVVGANFARVFQVLWTT